MKRKIILSIGLITIIPFLVFYYIANYFTGFSFYTEGLVAVIAVIIGILGIINLFHFINLMKRLDKTLTTIANGDLNQKADVVASSGTEDFALSVNQVSQRLRESADELEKRAILIERTNKELKRISELKSRYLSDVVRELRAPLINIDMGSAFLLENKNRATKLELEEFLQVANDNARRLIHMVKDLLDISKMESGEMSMHYGLVEVKDVIQEAINSVERWKRSKELQLELKGVSDLPKVYVDRDRIIQVLINLLSNAIKFTPAKGKIIIESKIFKKCTEEKFIKDTEETFVMISVKDTGFGIPATQKNTLFARHKSQQEISSYNTLPSTGLGLPIAKQIVEMHGGDIWAESQLGYGSRFTFIVPCRRQSGIKGIKPDGSIIPKSILIIDDEKMVREFLGRELEKKGYMVAIARDGLEGLQKALEHYYDLVITDVRMPNIDAINCIKILKRINPNVFFIVITGFSTEQDLKEMLKQHNYPCLKKPFDLPEFLTTVEKVCSVSV